MNHAIEELARSVAEAPDDVELVTVFADALLEQKDPAWNAMGELVVASRGETKARARELTRALRATGKLPSKHFVRYTLAHGLVRRVDIGSKPVKPYQLEALFQRPELTVVTEVDLRRAWPLARRARTELVKAYPKVLPKHVRWLGLGPDPDLEAAFAAFPKLTGLGLFLAEVEPLQDTIARSGITDLELACHDFSAQTLQWLVRCGLPLRRLVLYTDGYTPGPRELEPFLSLSAFPELESFGLMLPNERRALAFLEALAKSPLFGRLRSFGVALDGAEKVSTWLTEHHESWAANTLFTGPSRPMWDEPEWESTWDALASMLHDVDRSEDALAIREDLVFLDSKYGWYWDNLGDSRKAVGDLASALTAYERATKLDRESATPWQGMADVLDELERPQEALKAWTRAVELDPKDAYSRNGMAGALYALGRHTDAIAAYGQAWRLDKTFFHACSNRGDVHLELGHVDDAFADYERCLKPGDGKTAEYAAEPDIVHSALVGMANIWKVRGDFAKARDCLRRATRIDGEWSPDALLAQIAMAEGKLDAALKHSAEACARADADDHDRNTHAWLLLELGRLDEAEARLIAIGDGPSRIERAFLFEARAREAEALAAAMEDEPAGELYCTYHELCALLTRGLFLQRAGRKEKATACFHAAHDGPIDPIAMRAARGKGREPCDGEWCLGAGAVATLVACVLDGAREEAEKRAHALAALLEVRDPSDRMERAFDLRRMARLASIENDPLVRRALDVAEGNALPKTLRA